jgi:hypothetical protein
VTAALSFFLSLFEERKIKRTIFCEYRDITIQTAGRMADQLISIYNNNNNDDDDNNNKKQQQQQQQQ